MDHLYPTTSIGSQGIEIQQPPYIVKTVPDNAEDGLSCYEYSWEIPLLPLSIPPVRRLSSRPPQSHPSVSRIWLASRRLCSPWCWLQYLPLVVVIPGKYWSQQFASQTNQHLWCNWPNSLDLLFLLGVQTTWSKIRCSTPRTGLKHCF